MDRQKIAAVTLLGLVLAFLGIALSTLVAKATSGTLAGNEGTGRFFTTFLGSDINPLVFESIAGAIGVGAVFFAGGNLPNRIFLGVVALCVFDLALCLFLWVKLHDHAVASNLYNYGSEKIANAAAFRSAVNWAVGGAWLWLAGVVGTLSGVRAAR